MTNTFLAMLFRMKYINRWGLMHNTIPENLATHTLETALTAHFLANIGNVYFNKNYDPSKLLTYALYHDATEILTGDLPTPIKYYDDNIKQAYKNIEQMAANKILNTLPTELMPMYQEFFTNNQLSIEEEKILKSADKVCAYIKCCTEVNLANKDFTSAHKSLKETVYNFDCRELKFFLENYIDTFLKNLDDLGL